MSETELKVFIDSNGRYYQATEALSRSDSLVPFPSDTVMAQVARTSSGAPLVEPPPVVEQSELGTQADIQETSSLPALGEGSGQPTEPDTSGTTAGTTTTETQPTTDPGTQPPLADTTSGGAGI